MSVALYCHCYLCQHLREASVDGNNLCCVNLTHRPHTFLPTPTHYNGLNSLRLSAMTSIQSYLFASSMADLFMLHLLNI